MLNGHAGQVYERFLELPVAVVLPVLWLLGAVLEGVCLMALVYVGYWCVFALW
jgi:hypothetical protein